MGRTTVCVCVCVELKMHLTSLSDDTLGSNPEVQFYGAAADFTDWEELKINK